jgi:DNA mismatch endonuclease (patch repair protein)
MDVVSKRARSRIMRSVHSCDTGPEMSVRRILWALGYRYRLHSADLPGRPDIVFRSRRRVIFVHGCFWHQHDCGAGARPSSNASYWNRKLDGNMNRDERNMSALTQTGWKVLVLWECQIQNRAKLKYRLLRFLGAKWTEIR